LHIFCPICKTELPDAPEDFGPRPFCSVRCKLIDLGNWLSDKYVISEPLPEDDSADAEGSGPPGH
jgi:uncharacterized protein